MDLTPCVEWPLSRNHRGYGKKANGRRGWVLAHRWVWEKTFGAIPDGMYVLHRCDNPPCTNPEHLFLGTHADNMADKRTKGRCASRLTQETATYAMARLLVGESHSSVGKAFGVDRVTICNLWNGRTWRHLFGLN